MTPLPDKPAFTELTSRKLKASVDPERIPLRSVDWKLTLCDPRVFVNEREWLLRSIELPRKPRQL